MTQRDQTRLKDERIRNLLNTSRYVAQYDGTILSTRFKGHVGKSAVLKPRVTNTGYETVMLVDEIGKMTVFVHRIIAWAFISNPMNMPEVNHIDGDKRNNCPRNLEWVTSKENTNHAEDSGLRDNKAYGSALPQSKLDDVKVKEIKARLRLGERQTDLAREFGVEYPTIYAIRKGITWRHVE